MTRIQIQTKMRSDFTQIELWRLLLIHGIDPVYMDSKSTFMNLWNKNWGKYSFSLTILKNWWLCDNILTDETWEVAKTAVIKMEDSSCLKKQVKIDSFMQLLPKQEQITKQCVACMKKLAWNLKPKSPENAQCLRIWFTLLQISRLLFHVMGLNAWTQSFSLNVAYFFK